MIEVVGTHPHFEPVGSFSLVDGLNYLVDELVRCDVANPGCWRLERYLIPGTNVATIGFFILEREHPQQAFFSHSPDWKDEALPLVVFAEVIAIARQHPVTNLDWLRERHGSADMFRRLLMGIVNSSSNLRIGIGELHDKTTHQLVAYCVGLITHGMSVSEVHAFADEYR